MGNETSSKGRINRRSFLNRAASMAGAATLGATASTALSYGRIMGANDRISLATSVSAAGAASSTGSPRA